MKFEKKNKNLAGNGYVSVIFNWDFSNVIY